MPWILWAPLLPSERTDFDIGILRLQIFTYAGQRAARSDACDEDIYLAVGVAPDLWTGGRPVDRRVGRIDELAGNKAVRDLQRQLGGLGDRALHALGALCEDKLRSVCFQNIASLHAHGLGHRQNNAVALRGCDRRKTDTGIAGCGPDPWLPRLRSSPWRCGPLRFPRD